MRPLEAYIYKATGEILPVHPKNGQDFTLDELSGIVGGFIEVVYLDDATILVCNEEGKMNALPVNANATKLWVKSHGNTDIIVGDVLVCHPSMVK